MEARKTCPMCDGYRSNYYSLYYRGLKVDLSSGKYWISQLWRTFFTNNFAQWRLSLNFGFERLDDMSDVVCSSTFFSFEKELVLILVNSNLTDCRLASHIIFWLQSMSFMSNRCCRLLLGFLTPYFALQAHWKICQYFSLSWRRVTRSDTRDYTIQKKIKIS